jgi:hypothetical protein
VTPEQRFHLRHRAARNRWIAEPSFPREDVLKAYEKPQVCLCVLVYVLVYVRYALHVVCFTM